MFNVNIWHAGLIALLLLLAAGVMMFIHVRTWHTVRQQDSSSNEVNYYRRQFRRRMQSSAMLGLLGVALFIGQLITRPILEIAFWGVTLILVVWLGLLAGVDIIATRYHFGRLRRNYLIEQVKLQAELRRIQNLRRNGRSQSARQRPAADERSSTGRHPSSPSD